MVLAPGRYSDAFGKPQGTVINAYLFLSTEQEPVIQAPHKAQFKSQRSLTRFKKDEESGNQVAKKGWLWQ